MALSSNTKKLFIRILLFLVYLLLGAAIFYGIEHGNEEKLKDSNNFAVQYKNFTDHYKISKEDMVEFIDELQKALKLGYNVSEERWTQYNRWDFMNAFHFAGNVVTTIAEE
ncbi:Potassium channel subfamily K member 13 [Exaiptasia diaphana]|nr:Potassium channel subfamily K member 13 [Exaiptasia diaphana]